MSDQRAAYWRQLLGAWEQSGLSQAEFCRRRGLKAVNLAWWKRCLKGTADTGDGRRARRPCRAGRNGFVEVALQRGSSSAAALRASSLVPVSDRYELVLPGGVGLRLPDDFDPERVARLVRAVTAAC
jgi:hypothetical protein